MKEIYKNNRINDDVVKPIGMLHWISGSNTGTNGSGMFYRCRGEQRYIDNHSTEISFHMTMIIPTIPLRIIS